MSWFLVGVAAALPSRQLLVVLAPDRLSARVTEAFASPHPPSALASTPEELAVRDAQTVELWYDDDVGGATQMALHVVLTPEVVEHQHNGDIAGGPSPLPDAETIPVRVPPSVTRLTLLRPFASPPAPPLTIPIPVVDGHEAPIGRRWVPRATRRAGGGCSPWAACPVVEAISVAGSPATQINIVLMSAGYTAGMRGEYNTSVQRVVDTLRYGATFPNAPWRRYFPLFNVWSVWLPSTTPGVAEPLHDITSPGDPLSCAYGRTTASQRGLACDMESQMALASYAPAPPERTFAVAVVRSTRGTYGGSGRNRGGRYGVAAFYDGDKLEELVVHELGHTVAGLSDEYSYGSTAPEGTQPLKNCHPQESGLNGQGTGSWVPYTDASVAGAAPFPIGNRLVAEAPLGAGCTHENFVRPTEACLMKSYSNRLYCPVCRGELVRTYFAVGQVMTTPRYPRESETILVLRGVAPTALYGTAYLVANRRFLQQDGISVAWVLPSGNIVRPPSVTDDLQFRLGVTAADFGGAVGIFVVELRVADGTDALPTAMRGAVLTSMSQTAYFRVQVADSVAAGNCTAAVVRVDASTSTGGELRNVCARCDAPAGATCEVATTAQPFQPPNETIPGATKEWALAVGIGAFFILVCLAAFALIYCVMRAKLESRASPLFALSGGQKAAQIVCMIGSVVLMVAGVTAFVAVASAYSVLALLLYQPSLIVIVCGGLLVLVAFVPFSGAYFRSIKTLAVAVALCVVLLVIFLAITAATYGIWQSASSTLAATTAISPAANSTAEAIAAETAGAGIKSSRLLAYLRDQWMASASARGPSMCQFEATYQCSGFDVSCASPGALPQACPLNCEASNRNSEPCNAVVLGAFVRLAPLACVVALVVVLVVAVCVATISALIHILRTRLTAIQTALISATKTVATVRGQQPDAEAGGAKPPAGAGGKPAAAGAANSLNLEDVFSALHDVHLRQFELEFFRLDVSKDGKLNERELRRFLADFLEGVHVKITPDMVKTFLARFDRDKDGQLSFSEFMAILRRDPTRAAVAAQGGTIKTNPSSSSSSKPRRGGASVRPESAGPAKPAAAAPAAKPTAPAK